MHLLNINDIHGTAGRRDNFFFRYFLLFALLIFCIFQFNIDKIYGFSLYPDEFGYWASAARILGYDWSDTAALGSYYSYGYGMLLAPVLMICRDCVTAYRVAIALNMLLQCGAAGMLWGIFRRLHPTEDSEEKRMQTVLAVGTAVLYPPWTFCVQMTMTEAVLMFLYILVCYRMLLFVEKPKVTGAVFLALSLLYLYFVHMRTVAVVIAAVLTMLLYAWKTPTARRTVSVMFVILIIGTVCGLWVKGRITDTVYAAADSALLSVNDYAGRVGALKYMFTLRGMKAFFLSAVGKLYYLIAASFGMFVPAVAFCLKRTWELFRGFSGKPASWFCFFGLLSVAGQSAMTAIVTMSPGRLDGFVYGRYSEHLLPVFIGIGLMAVCDTGHKLSMFFVGVGTSMILSGITFWDALHSGLTVMQGYFAPGISYLSDDWNYDIKTEFPKAYLFGIFLMACVMAGITVGKRFGKYMYALAGILLMEILLACCLEAKYIKPFNDVNYYNLRIAEYMEGYEEPVTYLYGGGFQYIDLIQFALRDRHVEIIRMQDPESRQEDGERTKEQERSEPESLTMALPEEGFLIVDQGCRYLDEIGQRYTKCAESQAFVLFMAK